jgi:hypothetical protein
MLRRLKLGTKSEIETMCVAFWCLTREVEAESELEQLRRCQNFTKRSRESDQLIDSIFKLKIIHVGEVAYKRSRTIGGYFGETREAEFGVKSRSCAEVRRDD